MTEKKKKRPVYSAEFKAEAIAKCLKIGKKQTSQELGVSSLTLTNWLSKSEQGPLDKEKPSYEALERENARLKKENQYIKEISEILKKSTAIFSSKELGGLR